MAPPSPTDDDIRALAEDVVAEAKHVERRARLLKKLAARLLDNLQSKEDTR